MADNHQRPYQTRDVAAQWSSEPPARSPTDDPLAELARLIGQMGSINDPRRNGRNNDERYNSVGDIAPPVRTLRPAQAPNLGACDDNRRDASNRAYRDTAELEIFTEDRNDADSRYQADSRCEEGRYGDDHRYEENTRYEDTRYENDRYRDDDRNSEDDGYAADNRYERDDQSEDNGGHQDGHDDDNEDGHDYSDDHDADDEAYADGNYEDDTAGGRKRGGFIFVATIFALAVLGTAGAFGYRAIFGASMVPSLPPIIKAEDGPNKIRPAANAQSGPSGQTDANNDSNEKLVSREEQPVSMGAPAPQEIGPGSATAGYPIGAMATGGPGFAAPPNSAGAASTPNGSVPTPPPADPGPSALSQPAPSAPVVAAPAPAAPAIKKNAPSSAQRAPKPSSTADANAPLSIVPSGGEIPAPATPAAGSHSAPAHHAPVNTAGAATNNAPASAGGGYAVQVSSQHAEAEVQDSFRALQAKYPNVLGGKQPIIRRADLGAKGIYYRALVGPFASAEEAARMCSSLKAAGGSCLVQKN